MTHYGPGRKEEEVINFFWEGFTRVTKDGGGEIVSYRLPNYL